MYDQEIAGAIPGVDEKFYSVTAPGLTTLPI
jgi:hypothetical protein